MKGSARDGPARVAMWSGPRNISTAMMRSWGSRPDCAVVDEPFYACYLARVDVDHPGRDEVLASQSADWDQVLRQITTDPVPGGAAVFFQKQMTHHVLPGLELARLGGLRHAFLIRDPAEMLCSYARVRSRPTMQDLGLPRQVELYERFGGPVVDARDVLVDPEGSLRLLCAALEVPFDPAMLSWPAGRRAEDGVWASHWYDSVRASTGFRSYRPSSDVVPPDLEPLLSKCVPYYETLAVRRLRPGGGPRAADL